MVEQREDEKRELVRLILDVRSRKEALDEEERYYRDRLQLLMDEDGDSYFETYEGRVSVSRRRSVKVHSPDRLVGMLSPEQLAQYFKPPVTFIDAARKEGLNLEEGLTVGVSESFQVSRKASKDQEERARLMREESMKEAENRVEEMRIGLREGINKKKRRRKQR